MIHLQVTVANPAELLNTNAYGAGALLRWESGPTQTGAFVEGGTVALVASTVIYDIWDPAGVEGTWYRTRISNSAATTFSAYSEPIQGGVPTRYAELDDVLAFFDTEPNAKRQARLLNLLDVATAEFISEMNGRDFFRHPATGSATWWFDALRRYEPRGRGDYRILHAHDGIVSLDTFEISQDAGASFTSVVATDYVLRGSDPESPEAPAAGEPYFHIVFTGLGSIQAVPRGVNVARGTGVRGWPAVPRLAREAVAERARQLAFADPSYSGNIPGPSEYGTGSVSLRWPQTFYDLLETERHRFWCNV